MPIVVVTPSWSGRLSSNEDERSFDAESKMPAEVIALFLSPHSQTPTAQRELQ